jgi:hypothetical protein
MKNSAILLQRGFAKAMVLGIAATTITILGSAPAYGVSFTGALNDINGNPDPDVISSVFFTADGISTINFRSYGYAGGTNADGTPITAGGFSPVLTLFDLNDRYSELVTSSADFDFDRFLPAGTYRAVISTFPNLIDDTIDPNPLYSPTGFLGGGDFGTDSSNNSLTSAYAFDVVNKPTAVPEPSSLIGTVLAGFAVVKLKRKLSARKKLT